MKKELSEKIPDENFPSTYLSSHGTYVICSSFNSEDHYNRMKSLSIEHVYEKPLTYGNIEYIMNMLVN